MRKQTKANQHRWQRTKYETLQPLKKKILYSDDEQILAKSFNFPEPHSFHL